MARMLRRPATVPATLRLLLASLVLASLAWAGVAAWVTGRHAAAAGHALSVSEPLSLDAQRMYLALADADTTVTSAFLGGPAPLPTRRRYQADLTRAAAELALLREASSDGSGQISGALAALSAGLPAYADYVARAQAYAAAGYGLTGGSFMQVASEQMHLTLLPAARTIYQAENASLGSDVSAATDPALVTAVLILAVALLITAISAQRWLTRRTNRLLNPGLAAATAVLLTGAAWFGISFAVARADLSHAVTAGSAPAQILARASIDLQLARGDQILNLISRSGAASFRDDFQAVRAELGPGAGTLLTRAAAIADGTAAGPGVAAAIRELPSWYAAGDRIYQLDLAADYATETRLVIGTGQGSSADGFSRLERALSQAISAEQAVFNSSATAGADAYGGLRWGLVLAGLLMAGLCAIGLNRRLAEYR